MRAAGLMAGLVDPVGVSCLMSPVALGCGENLINIIAGLHERAMRYPSRSYRAIAAMYRLD